MVKIEGRITLLFSDGGMSIELKDANASVRFASATLNQEQTCQVMSRLGNTHCEIEIFGLENVGKKYEHDWIEFEIPGVGFESKKDVASQEAKKVCPDGWIPSFTFNSQNSFFNRDGKYWARCNIH